MSVDVRTNQLTAWSLGTSLDFDLAEFRDLASPENHGSVTWLVDTGDHVVSVYPPGAALSAAPFYALTSDTLPRGRLTVTSPVQTRVVLYPEVPAWPAVVTASLWVALGVAGIFLALVRTGAGTLPSLGGALIGGFGTGAFSVGADTLWQHGVAVGFVGMFLALVARDRFFLAGLMGAGAVLTRPQTAFVIAAVGLYLSIRRREWGPALRIGSMSSVGAIAYLAHQGYFFRRPTRGEYLAAAADVRPATIGDDLLGMVSALFDMERGLLVLTPIALVSILFIPAVWPKSPDWVRGAALGALVLFIVQMRGQVWHGGSGFFGYRYMIEPLWAATPLLFLAGRHAWNMGGLARRALAYTAAASVIIHTIGAATPYAS